jgi:RNA polymerase sigma-70 factor, ECF subfamily
MALDQETLMRLLTSEESKLRAYTWQIVRDDHVAEEVVQDMAVLALQKCGQINGSDHFPAWARRTCRNLALDAVRKKPRRPYLLSNTVLDLLESRWERLDGEDGSDLIAALRKCVDRLTDHARQVLEIRYAEGLRCGEVANRMGVKVDTVYVTLLRIHRTLAECIESERRKERLADE